MSRENVEVMRRFHDAFNRRDVDAFLAPMHPDVELVPATGKARALEAVRQSE